MIQKSPVSKERGTRQLVTEVRRYGVLNVEQAKKVATTWLARHRLDHAVGFGLPEVDDRYHIWRVPLLNRFTSGRVGEAVVDARSTLLLEEKTTRPEVIEARLLGRPTATKESNRRRDENIPYLLSAVRNTVACGDSEEVLQELPADCVDLVFTSPPYYNARPEYTDYLSYDDYLDKLRRVIRQVHRVLAEGRFFVINVSPVLIRRTDRNASSKRIAVPFDVHRLFVEEGYDFIDDIIWVKPEGAGWATGRGRRFAADRNPLQYKPVPVTEYVLVYRKHTDKLIDWHIRSHPDREVVQSSKIHGAYEKTNIWYLKPAHHPVHPAVFPEELAARVVSYYSFKNDVVLDPFAGIGTVGRAASQFGRRFVLIEQDPRYVKEIVDQVVHWLGKAASDVFCMNCPAPDLSQVLL